MDGPTAEEREDLLMSCRYGEIDDLREFVNKYGTDLLDSVRDENGNCVLHMVAGNGHLDILDYLLPIISPSLLSVQNNAGSTALHWAAINSQLKVTQKLIQHVGGLGSSLIDIKNAIGHSPLAEAEMAGWEEGAKYMVQVMNINLNETEGVERGDEDTTNLEDETTHHSDVRDIETEIQGADGRIAK